MKDTFASDNSENHENFWSLIQADVIIANQQMKMNEILVSIMSYIQYSCF